MAFPLTPLAVVALRYGAVAAAGYAAARFLPRGRFPRPVERRMDIAPQGFSARQSPGQISATARLSRIIGLARIGPRFQIDATALARLKVRRLT